MAHSSFISRKPPAAAWSCLGCPNLLNCLNYYLTYINKLDCMISLNYLNCLICRNSFHLLEEPELPYLHGLPFLLSYLICLS